MPPSLSPRTRALLVLLCVSAPSFMMNLDANIVAVSLPAIAHSLHADFARLEWVVSAYTLAFASLVLPAGTLADRFGRKPALVAGSLIFGGASLLCGAAPTIGVLIAARVLQGIGAAIQLSAGLATLSHAFRGAERVRAFAFWGTVVGGAVAIGPIAGGAITQSLGWEWAFFVNVPVAVAMAAVALAVIEDSRDPRPARIDVPGLLLFAAALFLLTLGLISGNRLGWDSAGVRWALGAGGALMLLFVRVETASARPMLDLALFRQPTFLGANVAAIALAATLTTMLTYLPVYFEGALGAHARAAGLMMLPMVIPVFLVPRLAGARLARVTSGRVLLAVGLGLLGAGLLWMGIEVHRLSYGRLLGGMLCAGAGGGLLNSETAKVGMSVVPAERAGMASGIVGTVRFAGIVLGFAGLGAMLYRRVLATIAAILPSEPRAGRSALVQRAVAGDIRGGVADHLGGAVQHAAVHAVADGFRLMLLVAGAVAVASAVGAWLLVRDSETAPVTSRSCRTPSPVLLAE